LQHGALAAEAVVGGCLVRVLRFQPLGVVAEGAGVGEGGGGFPRAVQEQAGGAQAGLHVLVAAEVAPAVEGGGAGVVQPEAGGAGAQAEEDAGGFRRGDAEFQRAQGAFVAVALAGVGAHAARRVVEAAIGAGFGL
jgi:hypothetical protein